MRDPNLNCFDLSNNPILFRLLNEYFECHGLPHKDVGEDI